MTLTEATDRACREPTLVKALTFIAVWETERVVKQARANPRWETCFEHSFNSVFERWRELHP